MNLLFGQILNGIATGMLYALMGLGLALITGILNIPNFAHGALFAVGAYLLVTVVGAVGNFWLGLLIAPLGVALLGLAIEWAGIRRLYSAGELGSLWHRNYPGAGNVSEAVAFGRIAGRLAAAERDIES